jgi:predicted nucleic acid-binding protein
LTDSLYFDNDCLSAFLWVKAEHILVTLYLGRLFVPQQVYNEISVVPPLKNRLDALITAGDMSVCSISADSPEEALYTKFAYKPDKGHVIIGKGEAAAIALASANKGILASNNLKDVALYVDELGLRHTTTADILAEAYKSNIITEADGNNLWQNMLAKKRKLGAVSFSDYLSSKS